MSDENKYLLNNMHPSMQAALGIYRGRSFSDDDCVGGKKDIYGTPSPAGKKKTGPVKKAPDTNDSTGSDSKDEKKDDRQS